MGSFYPYFDRIEKLYVLEGIAENESPLRVGTGGDSALGQVDNPVLTLSFRGRSVPIIPGSSWKGALRAEAERFVRSTPNIGSERGWDSWRSCDIFEVTDDSSRRKAEEENPCVVCSLFGNTGLSSHLRFFDSTPIEGTYSLETIARVAIERSIGGQSPGRLFKVQVISPGARWNFRLTIINVDLESEKDPTSYLARYVVQKLFTGLQLGGGKSVGYGLIRLLRDETSLKVVETTDSGLQKRILDVETIKGPEVMI